MQTVLFVIHIMVIVALVGVVLLQRSEGGGLGIGGGGGFMTSRGTANVLTRTTAILAVMFFLTSIGLSLVPRLTGSHGSILDTVQPAAVPTAPAQQQGTPIGDGKGGVLNQLNDLVKQQQEKNAQQPANAPVAPAVDVPPAATTPAPAASEPVAATPAPATSEPAAAVPAPAASESTPAAPAAGTPEPASPTAPAN
jgi:preprotein translocase subunit SecG